ncbi:MAG: LytTR family transcriptional regulator, partial [Cyclobacteriaceae bacterium]|nr:LytTR family transcriptional regulator [Cyclobacteriaceae bacterium]
GQQPGKIIHLHEQLVQPFKSRFMVRIGEHIKSIPTEVISYFFSREKGTFCVTNEGKKYLLDYSLEFVEKRLDPKIWYRINRKYIIHFEAVNDIISYSNSRLKVLLPHSSDNEIIVARERVRDFKNWLDQ